MYSRYNLKEFYGHIKGTFAKSTWRKKIKNKFKIKSKGFSDVALMLGIYLNIRDIFHSGPEVFRCFFKNLQS